MSHGERLSGLDSSFLHLEGDAAHMHVAAVAVFDGPAPSYADFLETVGSRLHLVPRYRQRLAFVPLEQGRPVWVDDPQFRLQFHVRHTGLPKPGGDAQLKQLAGRVFSQGLDRSRPLWELWLVEGLAEGRFAVLSKTHHALVDGVAGVDLASVIFDTSPEPEPVVAPSTPWVPRPLPSPMQLLADALVERATLPAEVGRSIRAVWRGPRRVVEHVGDALTAIGALAWLGLDRAPPTPFNVPIGPHRRFTWVDADLEAFRAVKDRFGVTVNDVVLAAVAGALGRYMRAHDQSTSELTLKAMVPVSTRRDHERGVLGNRLTAMWAPLPVDDLPASEVLARIGAATAGLKQSGQAVGAQVLTGLSGFAPPTLLAQAARLQARQRVFNLVVTNVPGPQFPLYVRGRRLRAVYPLVPLAKNTALGIAIMSYDGTVFFGLNADFDALGDLETLADDLRDSIAALVAAEPDGHESAEALRERRRGPRSIRGGASPPPRPESRPSSA